MKNVLNDNKLEYKKKKIQKKSIKICLAKSVTWCKNSYRAPRSL